ncbi:5-dehydro-4-deoxyglucarate dehydratase [Devosia insulae DS-56]|uniref:Probable 5-dehydro-4-deoxyglucarate dehydratase n=1 Tax=Devosia insulae DS-56 TaxID=1116389 RepID=A0A1E5XHP2_9HYPH|nr:5-dehydro-4-deoxyglucarate dehydratase [Devosia insulae]OEO28113.1 5-dehydro-4-deoxyglucarate dehydratase [Devosia insulae DS-56]
MTFDEIKSKIGSGLLSFPVTDFGADGEFDAASYAKRLQWLSSYGAAGLFAAGGTGEFFSIGYDEYDAVIRTAVENSAADVPVLAGVGYGTRMAVDLAKRAEKAGAAGILVLPHYLMFAEEQGVIAHMQAICDAVGLGVIYYARDNTRLSPAGLEKLAEACPNFIGYKDGIGDLQLMQRVAHRLGDRVVHIGGLPTAEVFAQPYLEMGVTTYSSAVFNFVPELALRFYNAVRQRDTVVVDGLMKSFYLPLIELRDRKRGYAVSMIKAGADLVGRSAGKVRTPLTELDASERQVLADLIAANA